MTLSDIFLLKEKIENLLYKEYNTDFFKDFVSYTYDMEHLYKDHHFIAELQNLRRSYENLSEKISKTFTKIKSLDIIKEINFFLEIFNQEKDDINLVLLYNEVFSLKEEIELYKKDIAIFYKKVEEELEKRENQILNQPNKLGPTLSADEDRNFRKTSIEKSLKEKIGSQIRKYTDWKYPTLEIGPGDSDWSENLVGSDPLYIVDIHKEYLDKIKIKFPKKFSKRIRFYLIGQENNKSFYDLDFLPPNQLGFIFSWGVFDFYDYKEIDLFLTGCSNALRPGGVITFSYNDCGYVSGIKAFEKDEKTWMTQHLLNKLFDKNNLSALEFYCNENQNTFWVSAKKPGVLKSMKVSQPFASIHKRYGYEKVDRSHPISYNNQQIARIKQLAIQLNVDTEENIMNDKHKPNILLELVNIARMKK